jgi:hypothetical protein
MEFFFSFSEGRREWELVAESRQCQSKFFKLLKRAAHRGALLQETKLGQHDSSRDEVAGHLALCSPGKILHCTYSYLEVMKEQH